jgi:hypothetical protein
VLTVFQREGDDSQSRASAREWEPRDTYLQKRVPRQKGASTGRAGQTETHPTMSPRAPLSSGSYHLNSRSSIRGRPIGSGANVERDRDKEPQRSRSLFQVALSSRGPRRREIPVEGMEERTRAQTEYPRELLLLKESIRVGIRVQRDEHKEVAK